MSQRITLICGPPCAGKTTLARRLAQPDDVVLDFDDIAVRLGSPARWRHPPAYLEQAEEWMRHALRHIARSDLTAYIIRCAPRPEQRAQLARALQATVVLLNPGQAACLYRARLSGRPPGTATAIRWWYRTYRPHPGDMPCPADHASTAADSPRAPDAPTARLSGRPPPTGLGAPPPNGATAQGGNAWWPRP